MKYNYTRTVTDDESKLVRKGVYAFISTVVIAIIVTVLALICGSGALVAIGINYFGG